MRHLLARQMSAWSNHNNPLFNNEKVLIDKGKVDEDTEKPFKIKGEINPLGLMPNTYYISKLYENGRIKVKAITYITKKEIKDVNYGFRELRIKDKQLNKDAKRSHKGEFQLTEFDKRWKFFPIDKAKAKDMWANAKFVSNL